MFFGDSWAGCEAAGDCAHAATRGAVLEFPFEIWDGAKDGNCRFEDSQHRVPPRRSIRNDSEKPGCCGSVAEGGIFGKGSVHARRSAEAFEGGSDTRLADLNFVRVFCRCQTWRLRAHAMGKYSTGRRGDRLSTK